MSGSFVIMWEIPNIFFPWWVLSDQWRGWFTNTRISVIAIL